MKKVLKIVLGVVVIGLVLMWTLGVIMQGGFKDKKTTKIEQQSQPQISQPKPPDLKKQLIELEKDLEKSRVIISAFLKDHPPVHIRGKITDRERNSLQVWGIAINRDGDDMNAFGVLRHDANIIVTNYNTPQKLDRAIRCM